jgi:hypothetical protein
MGHGLYLPMATHAYRSVNVTSAGSDAAEVIPRTRGESIHSCFTEKQEACRHRAATLKDRGTTQSCWGRPLLWGKLSKLHVLK